MHAERPGSFTVLFVGSQANMEKNKGHVIVYSMSECPLFLCGFVEKSDRGLLNACVFVGQAGLSIEGDWFW